VKNDRKVNRQEDIFLNLKKFDGAGEIQLFIEITNSYLLYMGK